MTPERFRQIEELYHAARECTAGERASLLAQADPELRRAVESLLAGLTGGEFLNRAARNAPELLQDPTATVLNAGTCLGPYRIDGKLGEGGMGEVFRAVDTRLGRAVAIKTTHERFSARFEREARMISSLNHPNICTLFDVGPNYLAMELVEGPTLADRIKAGKIPLQEALAIARQIGAALEAAHEIGIVHRDLKPANIKIKPDGAVKVLDFGLAKIAGPAAEAETQMLSMDGSRPGQIIGTPAYMAPEQASAQTVDKRADIWAFGVVLYEMLTGSRLFQGETVSDTLSRVLTSEPQWDRVPPATRRLLKACLEKDRKHRLRDISDAWRLLDDAVPRPSSGRLPWIAAAALVLATALALWAPWRRPQTAQSPSPQIDLDLGSKVSLAADAGPALALSPDGSQLAFVSYDENGGSQLLYRHLDQPQAALLRGTDGATGPFFSPDGQWVGFFAHGKLKKVKVSGGDPVTLCDAPSGRGATWADDGNIIAVLNTGTGLSLIPSSGGPVNLITELGPGEACHRWPHALPGSKIVLFTASRLINNFDQADIAAFSLPDRRRKTVIEHAGMYPRYLPSGHLAYVTKGSLFAAPFDAGSLKLTGAAVRIGEVAADTPRGFAQFDVSNAGICVLRTRGGKGLSMPYWLDAAGNALPLGLEAGRYHYLRLSPDGTKLAYVSTNASTSDLFVYDWQRGIQTRLTNGRVTRSPLWSPDGDLVVFADSGGIFAARPDGGAAPAQLTHSNNRQVPGAFTINGQQLILTELEEGQDARSLLLPLEGNGAAMRAADPQPLFRNLGGGTGSPAFSPDGKWLAYSNTGGGNIEVYVRAFPDDGKQVQVSNSSGGIPIWSRNAHELFYRTQDQRIMAVSYSVQNGAFIPERPRPWSPKAIANVGDNQNLDLVPDGKRFVVLMPAESAEEREIRSHVTLVMNFFEEVQRRVAGRPN